MIILKNILVATDFGPACDAALSYGRALARQFGAKLHLLHAAQNDFLTPTAADPYLLRAAVQRRLTERLTDADRSDLKAETVLQVCDRPADAIGDYARAAQIDLIVIGTHGRTGLTHMLMGSVAERVVRTAPCPVLTVHQNEHDFVLPDAPVTQEARPS